MCVSSSDIYPVEYIHDASWKDTISMWTWDTKAFYNKIYSTTNDCTGTATKIFEYKLNVDAKQVVANSASSIMFVFVVAIIIWSAECSRVYTHRHTEHYIGTECYSQHPFSGPLCLKQLFRLTYNVVIIMIIIKFQVLVFYP